MIRKRLPSGARSQLKGRCEFRYPLYRSGTKDRARLEYRVRVNLVRHHFRVGRNAEQFSTSARQRGCTPPPLDTNHFSLFEDGGKWNLDPAIRHLWRNNRINRIRAHSRHDSQLAPVICVEYANDRMIRINYINSAPIAANREAPKCTVGIQAVYQVQTSSI